MRTQATVTTTRDVRESELPDTVPYDLFPASVEWGQHVSGFNHLPTLRTSSEVSPMGVRERAWLVFDAGGELFVYHC